MFCVKINNGITIVRFIEIRILPQSRWAIENIGFLIGIDHLIQILVWITSVLVYKLTGLSVGWPFKVRLTHWMGHQLPLDRGHWGLTYRHVSSLELISSRHLGLFSHMKSCFCTFVKRLLLPYFLVCLCIREWNLLSNHGQIAFRSYCFIIRWASVIADGEQP